MSRYELKRAAIFTVANNLTVIDDPERVEGFEKFLSFKNSSISITAKVD